jgi:hypothetical protein
MGIGNNVVGAVLASPLHRLLSGSTDLIRFTGRRSGRTVTTPTQYARHGDDLVILVGKPETKTWWWNFREDRDLDVLVQGRWLPMTGRAVVGAVEPEVMAPLLDAYLERFPKLADNLQGETESSQARHAVVVWCRPR